MLRSRPARISGSDIDCRRAAASSMASGSPSIDAHSRRTSLRFVSSTTKPGATAPALSANNTIAGDVVGVDHQRRDHTELLTFHGEPDSAGCQHDDVFGVADDSFSECCCLIDHVLAVVEDQQATVVPEYLGDALEVVLSRPMLDAECRCDDRDDTRRSGGREIAEDDAVREAMLDEPGRLDDQSRLAHTARPDQGDQPGLADAPFDLDHEIVAPDERRRAVTKVRPDPMSAGLGRCGLGRCWLGRCRLDLVLGEQPLVPGPKVHRRRHADFLGEQSTVRVVHPQRFRTPARRCQSIEEQPAGRFSKRLSNHEGLEVGDCVGRPTQVDEQPEPFLDRPVAEFDQALRLDPSIIAVEQIEVRVATPQAEDVAELLECSLRILVTSRDGVPQPPLERRHVDGVVLDAQEISGWTMFDVESGHPLPEAEHV